MFRDNLIMEEQRLGLPCDLDQFEGLQTALSLF